MPDWSTFGFTPGGGAGGGQGFGGRFGSQFGGGGTQYYGGPGQGGTAGLYAYSPGTYNPVVAQQAQFKAPVFTNSMSNWLGAGGGIGGGAGGGSYGGGAYRTVGSSSPTAPSQNVEATSPYGGGGFQFPGSSSGTSAWDPWGVGASQTKMLANLGSTGGYGFGAGGSGSSSQYPGYTQNPQGAWVPSSSYSPLGTAAANWAAWPNLGATQPAKIPTNQYSTQNMLAGLFPGESPGTANPYTMLPDAMTQLAKWGTPMPAPTNPTASYNAANAYLAGIRNKYNLPYAEQVATAYGPGGLAAVNRNFNPNIPGSSPLVPGAVSVNPSQNQTPSAYLYGNPSTGYPGVMAGMRQSAGQGAVTSQFQQAAGAGQQPFMGGLYAQTTGAPSWMSTPAPGNSGRY